MHKCYTPSLGTDNNIFLVAVWLSTLSSTWSSVHSPQAEITCMCNCALQRVYKLKCEDVSLVTLLQCVYKLKCEDVSLANCSTVCCNRPCLSVSKFWVWL